MDTIITIGTHTAGDWIGINHFTRTTAVIITSLLVTGVRIYFTDIADVYIAVSAAKAITDGIGVVGIGSPVGAIVDNEFVLVTAAGSDGGSNCPYAIRIFCHIEGIVLPVGKITGQFN